MIEPSQFQVNDAWTAFKLNDAPVATEQDGNFNVLALMDVTSCFILGTEFVSAGSAERSALESKRLIQAGYLQKHQLPKKPFMPSNLAADSLRVEAERRGIVVARVPEQQLLVCVGEARESFKEHLNRGSIQ